MCNIENDYDIRIRWRDFDLATYFPNQHLLNMNIEGKFQFTLWRRWRRHHHEKYLFLHNFGDLLISEVKLKLWSIFSHFQNCCHFEVVSFKRLVINWPTLWDSLMTSIKIMKVHNVASVWLWVKLLERFHQSRCVGNFWFHQQTTKYAKIDQKYPNKCGEQAKHDDVIKWKHYPRYWLFVRRIHRPRWIPLTKANDAELWCFLWSAYE